MPNTGKIITAKEFFYKIGKNDTDVKNGKITLDEYVNSVVNEQDKNLCMYAYGIKNDINNMSIHLEYLGTAENNRLVCEDDIVSFVPVNITLQW